MLRTSTLVFSFGLLAISSALPTTTKPVGLQTREWKECTPGTSYFKCYTYDGCYASDPCINPPTQSTCTNGTTNKLQRAMHVVVPTVPDSTTGDVGYFQVVSGQMDINEVGVFTGIPADAKTCRLHWKQGASDERVFSVKGSGLVSAVQLVNLDTTDGISWSDVEKATTIGGEAEPDLTYWDEPQYGAYDHGEWDLTCAETIYMKFETHKGSDTQNVTDYPNVYLEQDDNNGFYIKYTC